MMESAKQIEDRVRLALRRRGESLRKSRPGSGWVKATFGDYYIVNRQTQMPTRRHLTLGQLACECGLRDAD